MIILLVYKKNYIMYFETFLNIPDKKFVAFAIMKEHDPAANPNRIKDVNRAKELLERLQKLGE